MFQRLFVILSLASSVVLAHPRPCSETVARLRAVGQPVENQQQAFAAIRRAIFPGYSIQGKAEEGQLLFEKRFPDSAPQLERYQQDLRVANRLALIESRAQRGVVHMAHFRADDPQTLTTALAAWHELVLTPTGRTGRALAMAPTLRRFRWRIGLTSLAFTLLDVTTLSGGILSIPVGAFSADGILRSTQMLQVLRQFPKLMQKQSDAYAEGVRNPQPGHWVHTSTRTTILGPESEEHESYEVDLILLTPPGTSTPEFYLVVHQDGPSDEGLERLLGALQLGSEAVDP